MSNQTPKRRVNQPPVPKVSPQTWKELLVAADDFQRLAPWEWMHDSQIVGLRHPVTSEVLLASILGQNRTMFALLIYRRNAGHRWLLNLILSDGQMGGDEDAGLEQDLIKLEFTSKSDLWKEDRALLAAAGYKPAANRGHIWPQFRSMVPGGYPWHLAQAEADTLLFAIPRVATLARLTREHPDLWDDHRDGDIAFLPDDFDAARGLELIEWQPMISPPEPPVEPVHLSAQQVEALLRLAPAKGFHLDLDVSYARFPIREGGPPYFPKLALAVDRASGFVGGIHLGGGKDRDGAEALGVVLLKSLNQFERRPEAIHVQRPRVAAMLSRVAEELGIEIVHDQELSELNLARQDLETRFSDTP